VRRIISWEGEEKVPGILIEKGALVWEEPIPISLNGLHEMPIGLAWNVRREEDGSITAEFERKAGPEIGEDVKFTIYASEVKLDKEKWAYDGFRHVTHARVREIFSVPDNEAVGW